MKIDTSKFKDPYVRLEDSNGMVIQVKLDDEGVVIDLIEGGEVVDSTWKLYQEMIDGDEDEEAEACPGCGCIPGEGVSNDCNHPMGCGFWKENDEKNA